MSEIPTTPEPVEPAGAASYRAGPVVRERRNGTGVAALVVGVAALLLAILLVFAPLAALLGLIAVILGIAGVVRANRGVADNRGQAAAGLITGAIALLIGAVLTITVGAFFSRHATELQSFGRCLKNSTTQQQRQTCAQQFSDKVK